MCWAIPAANVILHRRDRPSRGERENPVDGIAADCVALGETTSLRMQVEGVPDASLYLSVPTHVARRNGLATGERLRVSLLAEAIHLMAWQDLREPAAP